MSHPSYRYPLTPSLAAIKNGVATHPDLYVRDAHDAHVVLEAVRLGILPIIRRRLLTTEREEVRSGHVYVWEEAQDDGGLLRWTDGRRWSQSRMRGDYLFYEEKVETTQDERDAKAARRARRASDPSAVLPLPTRRKDRPSKPNGLTKQTYSVSVHLPGSSESRKWHLVAYFSGNEYNRLPVVEEYDYLRAIQVPPSIFMNSKLHSTRGDLDRSSNFSDESDFLEQQVNTDSRQLHNHPSGSGSVSPTSPPTSPFGHLPHPSRQLLQPVVPRSPPERSARYPDPSLRLPPIPSNGWAPSFPPTATLRHVYSSEDRRVLDSFRVIL